MFHKKIFEKNFNFICLKWWPTSFFSKKKKKKIKKKNLKKKKKLKKILSRNRKKRRRKKNWKKNFEKNLSATFYIFSKCHFLSNGEGVSGHQAISGHPYQPTSNYRKNKKKKKSKKKIEKKKKKKNLSATFQIFSKCHYLNFLSHWGGCVWIPGHK